MTKLSMIIGADIVPTENNIDLFNKGNVDELFGQEIIAALGGADIRIFNLETPFCDVCTPIAKNGPVMLAPRAAIKGIKALEPCLLTLANNHIMDCGLAGFDSTVKLLIDNDISFCGAGENVRSASKPFIFKQNGKNIGIYACAEHEFSIASEDSPGANPFDPHESYDHISDLKSACDYVVVLYHGGKELYEYPSPYLRKVCRKMIEKGADLVVCQHSHCIGCYEMHAGGTIVYGQGDFLFEQDLDQYWHNSLLLRVEFGNEMSIEYIPIVRTDHRVRLADKPRAAEILDQFERRSREILKDGFIETEYKRFAAEFSGSYLRTFHGEGLIFRILNKLSGHKLVHKIYSDETLLAIRNYIECEAHRELIISYIKNKIS